MIKKIIRISFFAFFLISIQNLSAQTCFDNYKSPPVYDIEKNPEITPFTESKKFFETVKNCPAPDFTVIALNGDSVCLSKLKGKVVILSFWFMTCGACIAEMPTLNKLVDEYKSKDVVFLAPSRDRKEDIIKNFLPDHDFKPIIIPSCGELGEKGALSDLFKMYFGWPTIYIIDKKGNVNFIKHGMKNTPEGEKELYEKLKSTIQSLL